MSLKLHTETEVPEVDLQPADGARLYSLGEVADVLAVAPERVRAWVTAGLARPVGEAGGEWLFDFRQVTAVRTVCELLASGMSLPKLRRHLEALGAVAPDAESAADHLPVVERDGRLLVRRADDALAAADGQLHFDFCPGDQPPAALPLTQAPATAAEWHAEGVEQERDGQLEAAAESYRAALHAGGPDPQVCFDLAHVLAEAGQAQAAVERYLQAVELRPDAADAWNNLGVLLAGLGRPLAACTAFRRAPRGAPLDARARYNLADTLEETGRRADAAEHWRAYLRLDQQGERAAYARARLSEGARLTE